MDTYFGGAKLSNIFAFAKFHLSITHDFYSIDHENIRQKMVNI